MESKSFISIEYNTGNLGKALAVERLGHSIFDILPFP
jgi:hypothetical protein